MTKRTHLLTTKLPKTYEELEIQLPHCNSNLTTNYSNLHDENEALTLSDFAKQIEIKYQFEKLWMINSMYSYVVNVSCKFNTPRPVPFVLFFQSFAIPYYVIMYLFVTLTVWCQ